MTNCKSNRVQMIQKWSTSLASHLQPVSYSTTYTLLKPILQPIKVQRYLVMVSWLRLIGRGWATQRGRQSPTSVKLESEALGWRIWSYSYGPLRPQGCIYGPLRSWGPYIHPWGPYIHPWDVYTPLYGPIHPYTVLYTPIHSCTPLYGPKKWGNSPRIPRP